MLTVIKKIGLLENDPQLDFKKRVCDFLKLEPVSNLEDADLIDLSSLSFEKNDSLKVTEWAKKKILVAPAAAAKLPLGNIKEENIYVSFPLRAWALPKKILKMKCDDICGELTSLRITWTRPKKESSNEHEFLYNTLAGLIDIAGLIAETPLEQLYVEKVKGENNLFALAMFEGEIALEIEANESLPDSMEGTHFIKANFTDGIITNVPLAGHFNAEGSIYATDEKVSRLLIENGEWDGGDEIQNTYWQMLLSIKDGSYPSGLLDSIKIFKAINETLKTSMPVNLGEQK